jgi:hypothetical protein
VLILFSYVDDYSNDLTIEDLKPGQIQELPLELTKLHPL